jgi:spore germination protein YaaH
MRRFPPREPPPDRRPRRDIPRPEGPFERLLRRRPERDPAPLIIGGTIAFLAVVIIIVLGFSTLFGGDDAGGSSDDNGGEGTSVEIAEGITATEAQIPALPPGLVSQSDYFEFDAEEDVPITVKIPLTDDAEGATGLGFYSFLDSRWQRVAEANVTSIAGEPVAEGEFPSVPENTAVLRVLPQTYQVAGSIPNNTQLHADAQVTIVSPRDYVPEADGSVGGVGTQVRGNGDAVSSNPDAAAAPLTQAQEDSRILLPTIVGSSAESAEVVNQILADDDLREQHVDSIASLVEESELDGIDLEYPAVDANLASEFTEFTTRLADRLHDDQKRLSLSLPPPSEQQQAYDWEELGDSADIIKVLPLADPVAYWESMPGAIGQIVRDVDPGKVMLVINPFSIEDLGEVTQPIGYLQAMALAGESVVRNPNPADIKTGNTVTLVAKNLDEGEGASPLRWSEDAVTVSFASGGTERRRVFIENSFSASFKLEIVQAYRLGGIAVSDASSTSDVANLWPTINGFVASATIGLVRPNDAVFLPTWQAEGGEVGAGAGTTATWIAPGQAGTYNVVLVVSDGDHRFGRKLAIEVKKGTEASPTPLQTFGPTPTPAPTETPSVTPTPGPPPGTLSLQVGKRADGDDPENVYDDPETTSSGSEVTYRIVIDNDSPVEVEIASLVDDRYPGAVCTDNDEEDVVGQTLAADDGDADIVTEKGDDAIVCTFTQTVSGESGAEISDQVTVTITDETGNTGSDRDTAIVIIA